MDLERLMKQCITLQKIILKLEAKPTKRAMSIFQTSKPKVSSNKQYLLNDHCILS